MTQPRSLCPGPVSRWASTIAGAPAFAFGWGFTDGPPTRIGLLLAAVCALIGISMSIRGYRFGVTLDPDSIVVRGLWRSRRIPTDVIDKISEYPAVKGHTRRRRRWTPIIAFYSGDRPVTFVRRRNAEALVAMQQWLIAARGDHAHVAPR